MPIGGRGEWSSFALLATGSDADDPNGAAPDSSLSRPPAEGGMAGAPGVPGPEGAKRSGGDPDPPPTEGGARDGASGVDDGATAGAPPVMASCGADSGSRGGAGTG